VTPELIEFTAITLLVLIKLSEKLYPLPDTLGMGLKLLPEAIEEPDSLIGVLLGNDLTPSSLLLCSNLRHLLLITQKVICSSNKNTINK